MKQKSGPDKAPAEQVLKNIRRQTRRQYSAEEKIRIVLEGLRGEENISELCRREGIAASMYYGWSKEFLEAGKRRLGGDTAGGAASEPGNWGILFAFAPWMSPPKPSTPQRRRRRHRPRAQYRGPECKERSPPPQSPRAAPPPHAASPRRPRARSREPSPTAPCRPASWLSSALGRQCRRGWSQPALAISFS